MPGEGVENEEQGIIAADPGPSPGWVWKDKCESWETVGGSVGFILIHVMVRFILHTSKIKLQVSHP